LSKLNVEYIKIDAGASDCNLILGDNAAYVYVDVDTGVSSLIIQVKEGMGLRIKSDQVLSDDNYDAAGLYEVEGYYQTKNYDEATHQAEIKLDAAMSDVVVEFY
ncbi:MAG: hypothetical protein JXO44_12080, partial [Clostridia bacterium]|nr:hypothetical protein [Clostridia bacterium]